MSSETGTSEETLAEQQSFAEQVLVAEAKAVGAIAIGPSFHRAVSILLDATAEPARGSVVVSGLGKSGLIGQKVSATFASTGTPSHFMHPTEAMHGDLGRVRRQDVVLMLSYRGSTEEVVALAGILRQDGVSTIGIVGKTDCELGRLTTMAIALGEVEEACPLNLVPTTSTTAMLALGDALALCVMRRRNYGVEQYRKVHPGGAIGRLLMPVVEAMRSRAAENLPLICQDLTIEQAYEQAQPYDPSSQVRPSGALLLVDENGKLAGIFTDSDLRRSLVKYGTEIYRQPIKQFMTANPTCLTDQSTVSDAQRLTREHRYDELPVVDAEGRPLGLVDVQDLMALKVIEG